MFAGVRLQGVGSFLNARDVIQIHVHAVGTTRVVTERTGKTVREVTLLKNAEIDVMNDGNAVARRDRLRQREELTH